MVACMHAMIMSKSHKNSFRKIVFCCDNFLDLLPKMFFKCELFVLPVFESGNTSVVIKRCQGKNN
jgi:hypothetical protein